MRPKHYHLERHRGSHVGWLRAAVLGANDGILSTASIVAGVAAAHSSRVGIVLTGVSALVAGAMSMAAGEYVSVHSQSDTEGADLARERAELHDAPEAERRELAAIYELRGVAPELARMVSEQLMAKDALGAHARDELGIVAATRARPVQAALASAASFATGAVLPLAVVAFAPTVLLLPTLFGATLGSLALLGVVAARIGGANVYAGALRVVVWGAMAMAVTAVVGALFSRLAHG